MKLNKYFRREEFACECGCGFDTIDIETFNLLTKLREHFNKPIVITCGCRCKNHNEVVQFKYVKDYVALTSKSKHMYGTAVDFVVKDVSPKEVYNHLNTKYPEKYGIGEYETFTHIDARSNKARW